MSSKYDAVVRPAQKILPNNQNVDVSSIQIPENSELPRLGRPRTGKRSDPAFRQVSAWVRRDSYDLVTKRLFNDEDKREFSDLVQSLLEEWLKSGHKQKSTA